MTVRLYLEGLDKGWEIEMPFRPREGDQIYPTDQEGVDVYVTGEGWYLAESGVVEVFVGFTLRESDYTHSDMENEREFREALDFESVGIESLPPLGEVLRG
jgi:hypothetical protein